MNKALASNLQGPANIAGRVMVVDDHRQARESVSDILRHAGHTVTCVSSAAEALQLLDRESVDVIVTDLQMPGMTGLDFILELERRRYQSRPSTSSRTSRCHRRPPNRPA